MYFSAVTVTHVQTNHPFTALLLNGIRTGPACFLLSILFLCSCSTSRDLRPTDSKNLQQLWDSLDIASHWHTGLSVLEPGKNKFLFNYRGDNFFTPGSNTKILTLYAATQYLDDSIPAAYYRIDRDTMIVWGGGDPGTGYPSIHDKSSLIEFLKKTDKSIIFSNQHFQTGRFGSGWAWDDFPYNFQTERTAFPIYGNQLWVERFHDTLVLTPRYFNLVFTSKKDTIQKFTRNEWGTKFLYQYNRHRPYSVSSIPVSLFENDIRFIWEEATGKKISFKNYPITGNALQVSGSHRDTILKWMMHESDNFVAEQILLACALRQTGIMDESQFINKLMDGPLSKIPDSIKWVDGSGLSRYNLLTPESVIWLLEKIISQKGAGYVKTIFPAGGISGTVADSFRSDDGIPFVFAKSGSLRNVYCLSGILITRKGKVLLFSWMNNQFPGDSTDVRKSMEIFLNHIRDHY